MKTMNLPGTLILLAFTVPSAAALGGTITPERLRCEYLENPLGIDVVEPRLSWELRANDENARGLRQNAYQVQVASSPGLLVAGKIDLWDSGKVESDETVGITYAGEKLGSRDRCHWRVRVWNGEDQPSPWSEAASWSMGLLQRSDWTGHWIAAPPEIASTTRPAGSKEEVTILPLLRKRFSLDRPVQSATLHVSSLGYHRIELNGAKVGDHEFDPVQSDYSRRVYYVTHDVTCNLRRGENVLAASLGKGWYWKGIHGVTQDRPALLLELIVCYEDGSQTHVVSDDTWKAATSAVRVIGGRRNAGGDFGTGLYDARREQVGWSVTGFDDSAWKSAEIMQLPQRELSAQVIAPNRVTARFPAVGCHQLQPGEYLLDFGTNLTGRLRMKLSGAPGAEIGFAYYASHTGDREQLTENFRQSDRYICRGEAGEEFCPQFNWRAFRFVKVTGLPDSPRLSDAVAELISTDLPETSAFACSDPTLNRLHELVVHTHRCLTLGGIQVDCPHRERLGYGAEGIASLKQALYNFDAAAFYTKWTRDFQDGQDPQTGMVCYTAPFRKYSGGGPAWSGACILFPWYVYLFHGDKRILEEGYPAMCRWLECLNSLCEDGLLQAYGLPEMNIWRYLGDWASPRRPRDTLPCSGHWASAEENQVFNNLHYYLQITLVSRIAGILGRTTDARAYERRGQALREKINATFFDSKSARYTRGEQQQTYLALPLLLDVIPAGHRERVWRNLLADITRQRDGHLDFGVLGGDYTLAALAREGHSNLIYRMATVPDWPGWGHMIDQGASTLWEHWLPGDSSIHNSFLSIGEWFFSGLAGIAPDPGSPGFRRIRLRPQPVPELKWAKATVSSPSGEIGSGWKVDGHTLVFEFRIPPNTTAIVQLPAGQPEAVTESGRPVEEAAGVRLLRAGGDTVELEAQSGDYRFVVDSNRKKPGNPTETGQSLESRRKTCFGLPWPSWEVAAREAARPTAKVTAPYALARLHQSRGKDAAALEHIAGLLTDRIPPEEWKAFTRGHRTKLKTQYDGMFDPLGVVRAAYLYRESFSQEQLDRIAAGARRLNDWTGGGTENHRLMRWSNGYLLAQMFGGKWRPVREQDTRWDAARLMAELKAKLMSEGKFRYQNGGTSEYLSPAYLMAHVIPLLNLYDFADDAELRAAAEALLHLHLTHLALNAHQGYILEPHARVHGLQYTSGSNVACAGQFLAWIYFGHMDLPDEVLIGKGRDIIHTALSEFRPLPTLYDLANGGGKAAFPYAARSSAMGWPHAGDRLPRTVLRSVFRNQSYSIGTGYSKHVPDGFYLQHSTFGIAWSSKDPVAYLQCGHPYWRSDRDNPGGWQLAPTSPFMQTAHHENTAIALFHIPEVDPWPDAGRSDWIPYRNDHLKNLVKDAYVILPKSLDQRAAARGSGTEDGRWFFFREGNVYLGVYSLTRTGTPAVDRYRYSIKAQGVRHGDHWQTGFVFEVGTEFDDGTFVEFCEKLQDNPVTVTWGDAGHAAPELEYTDSQSDVLRLRYNPEMRQNEKGTIENQPAVWINGERLDYTRWPDMEGPGVLLKDGVLTVESEKQRTRIDWNGESPVISQAELAGTESQ